MWRYPVKSLGGERLIRSRLDTAGLPGDRILCLRDEGNGEILSAKRLPVMLGLQARYDEKSGGVMIVTTAGDLIDSADPFASALLGAQLGRVVSLLPLMEDDAHYRRRVPLNPDGVKRLLGLSLQDELPKADVPDEVGLVLRQYVTWPGSHFDVAPLHVVTRQSLEKLAGGSDDIARLERYRANLVLDCDTLADWPERAWIGHRLCIGDAVIAITQATVRCAMPRYAQPDLPDNPAVSSRLRDKTGHVLGVYARVIRGGMLECGAEVGVEPNLGERRYYDIPAFAQPGREASAPSPPAATGCGASQK
ncbi:MOSC domain-containing protein [Novosphingobium sp. ERN07]|nr:MOSC domain-containing protein [Novosphingobium sp. ERN07]